MRSEIEARARLSVFHFKDVLIQSRRKRQAAGARPAAFGRGRQFHAAVGQAVERGRRPGSLFLGELPGEFRRLLGD